MIRKFLLLCIACCSMGFNNIHQDHFKINTQKSNIHWLGEKVTGSHEGDIFLLDGTISLDHGKLIAASLTIDMNSITNTDIESKEYSQKLVDHLKNEDFFDVSNHPTAEFKMIYAKPSKDGFEVMGSLTIKGQTHPSTFSVKLEKEKNVLTAKGKISFDRTKYGITYGSGSFIDNLGDRAIYDEVKLEFNIIAESKTNGKHH